ncbi:unnamed protein product [Tilletia laevis]|uniref:LYR motif-containing protein Cup1-like N-terminal domain-containing protein n=1 Tax=Tilletia caries TaxID=13290 RepID=A0ABN7IPQ9_9BASI|nr:hypothetical protein CF335_g2966 [Tilletia laevis]CAD6893649.1 unnamed protein product [Tilletia caries]CAD6925890.1 unnamed protein product [Tilletia controversa]CAD6900529.1 unnamed protein product [Tilletia laevis]CAD6908854.1 unnamed protein product [Tilletia caries]
MQLFKKVKLKPAGLLTPVRVFYRQALKQARLLAYIWHDPVVFASHRAMARRQAESSQEALLAYIRRNPEAATAAGISQPEPQTREWRDYVRKVKKEAASAPLVKLGRQRDAETIFLKQIAAANVGWPHAVRRALDHAYGRSGPLRWELLKGFLPRHNPNTDRLKASPKSQKRPTEFKPELPRRLQSPMVSRSLRLLVLSAASHSASPPAVSQFELPPKLAIAMQKKAGLYPSQNEAVAALDGIERNLQAIGITRNREANARWRWLTSHIRKLNAPLEGEDEDDGPEAGPSDPARHISAIEARIKDRQPTVPKRLRAAMAAEAFEHGEPSPLEGNTTHKQRGLSPPYLRSARQFADMHGRGGRDFTQTAPEPQYHYKLVKPASNEASLSYNLVNHGGWARSGPVDYERQHRARRRMWADLLSRIPKAVYVDRPSSRMGDDGKTAMGAFISEADVALPDVDDEESVEAGHGSEKEGRPPVSRRLPTLQARSSTYRVVAAREWKFWADYGLEGAPSGSTPILTPPGEAEAIKDVRWEPTAHFNAASTPSADASKEVRPRAAQPDSAAIPKADAVQGGRPRTAYSDSAFTLKAGAAEESRPTMIQHDPASTPSADATREFRPKVTRSDSVGTATSGTVKHAQPKIGKAESASTSGAHGNKESRPTILRSDSASASSPDAFKDARPRIVRSDSASATKDSRPKMDRAGRRLQGRDSAGSLRQSEYAQEREAGPRKAKPDSDKWVSRDEMRWIWDTKAPS